MALPRNPDWMFAECIFRDLFGRHPAMAASSEMSCISEIQNRLKEAVR
jgi:hypothetical protein